MNSITQILILSANPKNTPRLRLDEEVREIEEGIRRSKYREQFTINSRWAVTLRDLRRTMLDYSPNIVHFCGHGEPNGLCLEDKNGNAVLAKPDALDGLFKNFVDTVECVFLNSCYSESQAIAINRHITYVIGIPQAIPDKAGIELAVGFYDGLGAGKSIEEAFEFGRNAIQLSGLPEHLTPCLLKNEINLLRQKIFVLQQENQALKEENIECQIKLLEQQITRQNIDDVLKRLVDNFKDIHAHQYQLIETFADTLPQITKKYSSSRYATVEALLPKMDAKHEETEEAVCGALITLGVMEATATIDRFRIKRHSELEPEVANLIKRQEYIPAKYLPEDWPWNNCNYI